MLCCTAVFWNALTFYCSPTNRRSPSAVSLLACYLLHRFTDSRTERKERTREKRWTGRAACKIRRERKKEKERKREREKETEADSVLILWSRHESWAALYRCILTFFLALSNVIKPEACTISLEKALSGNSTLLHRAEARRRKLKTE